MNSALKWKLIAGFLLVFLAGGATGVFVSAATAHRFLFGPHRHGYPGRARTVHAAVDFTVLLDSVSDHAAVAMRTHRRQRVDRALEAVEGVVLPLDHHFERFVIFVFANFACSHT